MEDSQHSICRKWKARAPFLSLVGMSMGYVFLKLKFEEKKG